MLYGFTPKSVLFWVNVPKTYYGHTDISAVSLRSRAFEERLSNDKTRVTDESVRYVKIEASRYSKQTVRQQREMLTRVL